MRRERSGSGNAGSGGLHAHLAGNCRRGLLGHVCRVLLLLVAVAKREDESKGQKRGAYLFGKDHSSERLRSVQGLDQAGMTDIDGHFRPILRVRRRSLRGGCHVLVSQLVNDRFRCHRCRRLWRPLAQVEQVEPRRSLAQQ